MRVSICKFCAFPMCFPTALRLDGNVAKVGIAGMVPQALQARAEEADVWATLLPVWCILCLSDHLVGTPGKDLSCKHANKCDPGDQGF